MLRYKFNHLESKIVISNDDGIKIKIIPYIIKNDIFVDILDRKEFAIKVRIFYKDEIIVGWVTSQIEDLIVIHNKEELFDGRFNSDKLN